MTQEEKARAYDEALARAKDMMSYKEVRREDMEYLSPELKKSENEKIRKELLAVVNDLVLPDEQKPDYCHHEVDLSNCSEEYRKGYYDGWNNCNMQHSQCQSESNDVVKCLINGMKFYYGDSTEATWGTEKFSMKVKDILSWLEKQGEWKPSDKVEPKFKVGDWVMNKSGDTFSNGSLCARVRKIEGHKVWFEHGTYAEEWVLKKLTD